MQRNAYHMSILKNNFDPVQRQNQWKQRVTAEERLLGENKMKALLAHEHIHHYDTLADPVASKGVFDERGRLTLPLSSRPISSVGRMISTSRSDLSTARSSVSNTSSLNSTTSNMTAIALERLDRLEQSLDDERKKREKAEAELRYLRQMMDTGAIPAGSAPPTSGRSARPQFEEGSGRSARASSRVSVRAGGEDADANTSLFGMSLGNSSRNPIPSARHFPAASVSSSRGKL